MVFQLPTYLLMSKDKRILIYIIASRCNLHPRVSHTKNRGKNNIVVSYGNACMSTKSSLKRRVYSAVKSWYLSSPIQKINKNIIIYLYYKSPAI